MEDTGTCSTSVATCKAGNYCATMSDTLEACLPCSQNIQDGQGCYCKNNTISINCQQCANSQCIKCIKGQYLAKNSCEYCITDCDDCTAVSNCQKCAKDHVLEQNPLKCVLVCTSNKQCDGIGQKFCNKITNRCEPCHGSCKECSSLTFCTVCENNFISTINGKCTPQCNNIADGNYCNDGAAAPCTAGLTSQCTCGDKQNCASCNMTESKCETCLPNSKLNESGSCTSCEDGFEMIGTMCWPVEADGTIDDNKLGGGAIAGIVIAVLVVAGAVGAGVWFMMKKKRCIGSAGTRHGRK
ncbi:Cysteine-rich membrane protein 2 [Spironucleus salmonicida]|uniref:Cysteine-rich membrane protein 2 n=1 Tax=Spironucleus salmonicida TaxID=348837 RepID=V6LWH4_9EUKA|nr:Cysteine-rich membrane protein 2 [Spironucleus salmonicida]|eukprot:EST48061.1 Cysteine-rich membrane protein 2 [Spironucleus salmonicida]